MTHRIRFGISHGYWIAPHACVFAWNGTRDDADKFLRLSESIRAALTVAGKPEWSKRIIYLAEPLKV